MTATLIRLADHRPLGPTIPVAGGVVFPFPARNASVTLGLDEASATHMAAMAAQDQAAAKLAAARSRRAPEPEIAALHRIHHRARCTAALAAARVCGARLIASAGGR